ncbi:translation initiation factor IF-3 [Candidatus Omnitrophota bacterium]
MTVDTKRIRHNGGIRAQTIRLIDADGTQVGVVSLYDGMKRAGDQGLDLVEISPMVNPPVCKIMDFGKYCYSLEKKEKDNKKKHKNVEVKEVKFTSKIEENDYQTKLRHCEKFLKRGDKVKVSMQFRGRERAHIDIGQIILDRLFQDIADIGSIEKNYGLKGGSIIVTIAPKM